VQLSSNIEKAAGRFEWPHKSKWNSMPSIGTDHLKMKWVSSSVYKVFRCRGVFLGRAGIHGKAAKLKRLAGERNLCVEGSGRKGGWVNGGGLNV